jgi:tRNA pseudouridine13 synthase
LNESDPAVPVSNLPYLTSPDLKIAGRLKTECADFVVEEVPAYEPSGEGEHLYLWMEKTDRSAEQLIAHIARTLKMRRDDVGMAGLKDRFAVTRQWVSVPVKYAPNVVHLDSQWFKVLKQVRHRNKLHTGHTRGNRFDLLLRDVVENAEETARTIAQAIEHSGVPNYFGEQRFGIADETLNLGLELLAGKKTAQDIPIARRKFLVRLAISAVQSAVFNEVLARRIEAGTVHTVREGDVMQVRASGGCFVVEDVAREQERLDRREISPTGPLFGLKLLAARGIPLEEEMSALAAFDLHPESFAGFSRVAAGARRALLTWPQDLEILPDPLGLRVKMQLPPGVYATTVLREFMKS